MRDKPKKVEPPVIAGRVPPHDLDAEAAVLSACLLSREQLDRVRVLLRPEHFYSDSNGRIFEAIEQLAIANTTVDIVSVASYLRDRERLQQVGGSAYLAQLADATPHVPHAMTHARIVYEKWRVRALIATCQRISAEGYGDIGTSAQAFIDIAMTDVAAIAKGAPNRRDPVRISGLLPAQLAKMEQPGGMFGVPTGYVRLDRKLAGLHEGDLIIVAGRPGMGKSAFAFDLALNVASPIDEEQDPTFTQPEYASIVFSLEMPREQVLTRHVCSVAKVSVSRVREGTLDIKDWQRIHPAAEWLAHVPIWIDDTAAITVAEIMSKVRAIKAEWEREGDPSKKQRPRRVGAVVVDYLQICGARGGERSKEERIANVSQDLKSAAKELAVPVIALAQLNRAVEGRGAKDKRPQLSDLRDSGQIEQDADAILFLYRPEYYAPNVPEFKEVAEVIVAKQRNGDVGRVLVRYQKQFTSFLDWTPEEYRQLKETYAARHAPQGAA